MFDFDFGLGEDVDLPERAEPGQRENQKNQNLDAALAHDRLDIGREQTPIAGRSVGRCGGGSTSDREGRSPVGHAQIGLRSRLFR